MNRWAFLGAPASRRRVDVSGESNTPAGRWRSQVHGQNCFPILANLREQRDDCDRVRNVPRINLVFRILGSVTALGLARAMADPITLPTPIYLENFNGVAEGGLPAGWYQTNYSDLPEVFFDLHDLDSASYATWVVVERARFTTNFVGYLSHTPVDYTRVLSFNPNNVVNGQTVTNLATGRFVFSTAGYREGNQVMFLFTPDFNLTGWTNVYVSYHSLYEQN